MDGPVEPPKAPPTPYREGKALHEIIPPDRRREKTIALILASMVAGVSLWLLGGYVLELLAQREPVVQAMPATPGYVAGRISPGVLHGPGGDVTMPPAVRSVIHVWLQGCADCMPAFEAMRDLEKSGGLGVRVPIINVAYGEADAEWAARYGVRQNLVYDMGGSLVVRPLGIGTFTTLVIDGDGVILHRDRPDKPGYRERVRAAVGAQNVEPESEAPPAEPSKLDAAGVERVVSAHRQAVKRACWERNDGDSTPSSVNVTVRLSIDPDGRVAASSATGDNPVIAKCIESQTRTWVFPAPGSTTTVSIPFKFVRQ